MRVPSLPMPWGDDNDLVLNELLLRSRLESSIEDDVPHTAVQDR